MNGLSEPLGGLLSKSLLTRKAEPVVDPAALKPAAIAQRARALLRAGTSARRYHDALANRI